MIYIKASPAAPGEELEPPGALPCPRSASGGRPWMV